MKVSKWITINLGAQEICIVLLNRLNLLLKVIINKITKSKTFDLHKESNV